MSALAFDSTRGRYACRPGCGACCIALSISSPIPGMPEGKPAGVRCVQLTDDNRCAIFDSEERPWVCGRLRPMPARMPVRLLMVDLRLDQPRKVPERILPAEIAGVDRDRVRNAGLGDLDLGTHGHLFQ